MKAVSAHKPGEMRIVEVAATEAPAGRESDAHVPPGAVEIAVRRVGLCGTDLRTFTGHNPIIEYPRIIGHEIGGVLTRTTRLADAIEYPVGTVVTINPYTVCGTCSACRAGRPNACRDNQTLGNQRDGAARQRLVLPADRVYPVPTLDVDQAACVEPLSVGFHAAARGAVTDADTVVVLGVGMIGLGAVAAAAARGATVLAVDLDDRKLAIAAALGARTINAQREVVSDVVASQTHGEGADVVVEAIGLPATYRQAVDLAAFAGRVVFIGYAKEDVAFTTKLIVAKELDLRGSRNALDEDFLAVIAALEAGAIPLDQIITHRFPLDKAQEAFELWAGRPQEVTKILLEVDAG